MTFTNPELGESVKGVKYGLLVAALAATQCALALNEYASAWGGVAIASSKIAEYSVDFDRGLAIGWLCGLECREKQMHLELEGTFRRVPISGIRDRWGRETGVSGDFHELAGYVNWIYAPTFFRRLTPFAGAGVGWKWERTRIRQMQMGEVQNRDSGLSAQLIVGLAITLTDRWEGSISYRHYFFESDLHCGAATTGIAYRFR